MKTQQPIGRILLKVIPLAFVTGAAIELFMIKVRIGSETFYDTARRLEQSRLEEKRQQQQQLARRVYERKKEELEND